MKKLLYISTIFIVLSNSVFAEDIGRGGYAGSALRMGLGARAMAMGGGSPALTDDIYAAYYNPAGLVFLENHQVSITMNQMALDRKLFFAGYGQSIEAKSKQGNQDMHAGFAAGWLAAGVDNIDGRDINGNHYDTFSNWEHCFYFSFAIQPTSFLSFGGSAKILHNRMPKLTKDNETLTNTSVGFDIGLIAKPVENITVGVSVHDLRSQYTWDTQNVYANGTQETDTLPSVILAGVTWKGLENRLLLSANIEKVDKMESRLLFGAEGKVTQNLVLRLGMRNGDITAGGGYAFQLGNRITRLDYAFVKDPVAPSDNHIFTWSFLF